MLESNQGNNRLGKSSQKHRTYKGARDGPWKGEVVISAGQSVVDVRCWHAVDQHIMSCLDIEGFFDLSVGGDEKVY